jgi:hypothetical protein
MVLFGILARYYKVLITLLALLLSVGYVYKLCWIQKGDDAFEYGYYDYGEWKEDKLRWTWRKANMRVKATSDLFLIKVVAQPHNSKGPEGLTFKIFLDGEMLDSVRFFNGGSRSLYYYMPNIEGKDVEIRTEVDRTFNPLRMGMSVDGRDPGVAVSPITFLKIMPKDGVGFYDWETWSGGKIPGWPENIPGRFRWTGMRASMYGAGSDYAETNKLEIGSREREEQNAINQNIVLTKNSSNKTYRTKQPSVTLFLMCAHPDIDKNPVVVKILSDNEPLKQETFVDHQWRKVLIKPAVFNNSKILTFQVNRTWNPKAAGISEDWRDLGVAIAVTSLQNQNP